MKHDLAAHLQHLQDLEKAESDREAPSSEQQLLEVQRRAGNQAVNALLVQAKLMVGKAGDPAERDADVRAAHVVAAMNVNGSALAQRTGSDHGGSDPLGGLDVSADLESEIDKHRGGGTSVPPDVRRAFGPEAAALDDVRVHTDGDASRLSEALQAKAFTTGSDIFFRQGTYNPASSDGKELLAHELSHVVQQSGQARRRTVRRRIEPATQYVFDEMSKKSTGKDKKGVFTTPVYLKIKNDLDEYVKKQDEKDAKWKAAKLKTIDHNIAKWMEDKKNQRDTSEDGQNRKEAMLWLVPRIQAEFIMIDSVKEKDQKGGGETAKGGVSSVELGVKSKKEIGFSKGKTGVFKAPPKGYGRGEMPSAEKSGIDAKDAKFTERAVASSAVAKLMGSDVLAETVKSTRGGQAGYLMEQAKGVQPKGEKKIRPNNDDEKFGWQMAAETQTPGYGVDEKGPYKTKEVVNEINWKDSKLQEQLVELQLIDAITGQVDRHASNYFVEQGPGKETKVKGIDPDLSFGKDKDVERLKDPGEMTSFDNSVEELPPICTQSTAKRILGMRAADLQALLGGTLSRDELQAAIKRLQKVQAHIKQLMADGCVFRSFEEEDENFRLHRFTEKNSYIGRDRYWQYMMATRG
ncbi:MAG: hypothetical protein QOD92_2230 [Acidimicrobiaceae bacterium]|jgi:hypothetical protein